MYCFSSCLLPNRFHQIHLKNPLGGPMDCRSMIISGSRLGGLTPFYVPVLMRVGCCVDRTWGGRSVAESGPSSAANSAGVWYPIPLCSRS